MTVDGVVQDASTDVKISEESVANILSVEITGSTESYTSVSISESEVCEKYLQYEDNTTGRTPVSYITTQLVMCVLFMVFHRKNVVL